MFKWKMRIQEVDCWPTRNSKIGTGMVGMKEDGNQRAMGE